jgi:hypothetical protein
MLIIFINICNMKSFTEFLKEDRWYDEPEYVNFGNADLRRLYGAIQSAEHRDQKFETPYAYNPRAFIRTRSPVIVNKKTGKRSVSTAYGPVQLTTSTVSGFMKTQPENFRGIEDYSKQFVAQGKKMLGRSGLGTASQYGGGGAGDLSGEEFNSPYQQLAGAVMRGKMKELNIDITKDISPEDRERFITSWRGASRKNDPKYFEQVDRFLRGQ